MPSFLFFEGIVQSFLFFNFLKNYKKNFCNDYSLPLFEYMLLLFLVTFLYFLGHQPPCAKINTHKKFYTGMVSISFLINLLMLLAVFASKYKPMEELYHLLNLITIFFLKEKVSSCFSYILISFDVIGKPTIFRGVFRPLANICGETFCVYS